MGYVGNSPAANFASVTKDAFSGDGSTTAFTLSKAATTNGVAVFVENVRQEPTTAYAVSGTTLTFTAAPVSASGNNIYVLHHNSPASTATHPSAQALTATSGTFSSTLNATSGTFTANPGVLVNNNTLARVQLGNSTVGTGDSDGVQLQISGTNGYVGSYDGTMNIFGGSSGTTATGITVDANGHVTMPKQTAFTAYPDQNQSNLSINATTTIVFDAELFDQNADFNNSNYTFTAPVTGKYMLAVHLRIDNMDLENAYYVPYIHTSNRDYYNIIAMHGGGTHIYNADPDYFSIQLTALADMDASDTAVVKISVPNAGASQADIIGNAYGNPITRFSGYLVA